MFCCLQWWIHESYLWQVSPPQPLHGPLNLQSFCPLCELNWITNMIIMLCLSVYVTPTHTVAHPDQTATSRITFTDQLVPLKEDQSWYAHLDRSSEEETPKWIASSTRSLPLPVYTYCFETHVMLSNRTFEEDNFRCKSLQNKLVFIAICFQNDCWYPPRWRSVFSSVFIIEFL